jgi:malate permease and related proteins
MEQFLSVTVYLALGVLMRSSGRFPETSGETIGSWVVNVALPAAILQHVHGFTLASDPYFWLAVASPWIGALLAIAVMVPLCEALGWSRQRCGALTLLAGWGNTSFVGLPLIAAYAGSTWMGLGLAINLIGSYLSLSTLGLAVAAVASSRRFEWRLMLKRLFTFPPLIALVVALAANRLERPEGLTNVLAVLGSTLLPLALATAGFTLRLERIGRHLGPLGVGICFRLLAAPLALMALFWITGAAGNPAGRVAVLQMAMAPMLGATLIAIEHDLEPEFVSLFNGIAIPLSMPLAWAWWLAAGAL